MNLTTLLSELKSIGLQVDKNLLDSFFIRLNNEIGLSSWYPSARVLFELLSHREIDEYRMQKYLFGLSLVELNRNNVLNTSLNVEPLDYLGELTSLKLSKA
jgi:hypothetical protein